MAILQNNRPQGEENRLVRACLAAADALRGGAVSEGDAAALLALLGYRGTEASGECSNVHRSRLLAAAAVMERMFQLGAPDAPGLAVFGGELDLTEAAAWYPTARQSVSGTGMTPGQAFEACIGEGVEFLSGLERAADRARFVSIAVPGSDADPAMAEAVEGLLPEGPAAEVRLEWASGTRLSDGAAVLLPADLCYRRDPARRILTPPGPQSIGCAAAPAFADAVLHGLLELIERDAAALWWRGGCRGRGLTLEQPALAESMNMLQALRAGVDTRRSWLLDITTDLGVPAVAAISVGLDGRGFCCGTAARTTLGAACQAALREMCQMELAHHVVQAKRLERGDASLNQVDRQHLQRCNEIDAATCALLHPSGWLARPEAPADDLAAVVERLARAGLQPCAVDLTRPDLGIPVARVMCPGLEQEPSLRVGRRLRAMISETGGGSRYRNNVPLM